MKTIAFRAALAACPPMIATLADQTVTRDFAADAADHSTMDHSGD
ncbi:hypothetical protein [Aquicoccus sp. SU-CL01552]